MTQPERLAITHYHLRPGGVTRVISHAAEAMARRGCRVVILSGREPDPAQTFNAEVRTIEGLDYDAAMPDQAETIAQTMLATATDALGGAPDAWHAHNHSLGKNSAYPSALRHLADQGHRLLLQMHDFAEDGRPANYHRLLEALGGGEQQFGHTCYPLADHVHYAVLNSRDHQHLLSAGLEATRVHLLPNAIGLQMDASDVKVDPDLFLYPTRAIRRKNIGEFLFWSALAEPGQRFATTLAPKNPQERPGYDQWVAFAQEKQLPAEFEAGTFADTSFTTLLASAAALVTTSVAEGFGLAFLEPFLVGRPVVGRNLPDITADFSQNQIDLSGLYNRLEIPVDWVDAAELARSIETSIGQSYRAYGRPCDHSVFERAMAAAVQNGMAEFGHLDEAMQTKAIEHMLASPQDRGDIQPAALCNANHDNADMLQRNADLITEKYGLDGYGQRLESAYQSIGDPTDIPEDAHLGHRVLDAFLNPDHFLLLRT